MVSSVAFTSRVANSCLQCSSHNWLKLMSVTFVLVEVPEELYGSRAIPRVMIVGISIHLQVAAAEVAEQLDPVQQVVAAIYHGLVPAGGDFLDAFAVAEPAHVSEIGGNQVQILFQLPRTGHEGMVRQ